MHGSRAEGSSPLATIEDIQRRLLRPSSHHSTSQISTISSSFSLFLCFITNSTEISLEFNFLRLFHSTSCYRDGLGSHNPSQLKVSFTESLRKQDAKEMEKTRTKRKLEDYLDPFLISTISSKIGVVKKVLETKPKKDTEDFEWPVDQLKVFVADSSSKNCANWRSNKAVDLGKDNPELSGKGGDEGMCYFTRWLLMNDRGHDHHGSMLRT
ncbi:hypothetical protein F2P56_007791 [Juglans regia]|uniref:Uncharacterized protein LOC108999007 isoform X1 n=2 Tax=Juglans regia TaxID=51240 RepID=A0A2I4FI69_JUGRE|nr:uncharacterized protein LOC108999007 isoform X1 [Juglans regia]KAF5476047.1 hypothetical protein F2P56_007791 [Juglans regia]